MTKLKSQIHIVTTYNYDCNCRFYISAQLEVRRTCGNNIVEDGEDCDCGTIEECYKQDPCCDPITCKLTKDAECASGPCCDNCQVKDTIKKQKIM